MTRLIHKTQTSLFSTIKHPLLNFLAHWAVWIVLYFITYLPVLIVSTKINWEYVFFTYVVMSSINFLLFYIIAFFLIPRIGLRHKRWIWVLLASLALAAAFAYLKFRLETWRMDRLFLTKFQPRPATAKPVKESLGFFGYRFRIYFQSNVLYNISIVIIAFAYRIYVNWTHQEKISKELENQKLKAELSFLKMQINPHFLFNALNNIYSLTVIEHSKRAGDSIMKLSEIMRYVLYEKEDAEHKVSLDKEIKQLNNYIDLEKLRHGDKMYFNFSIEGDTMNKRIAPLLLFPILENAFKHGLLSDPERPVNVELKVDKKIHFLVQNFKTNYAKDAVGGIGVQNVKKRLDLLYNDRYTFDIQETENEFIVSLALPL